MSANKIIIGAGLGAAAVAAYLYASKLKRTSVHLEVIPSAMIHKISFSGIDIRMDIRLKNPDGGSFKIKYPFIKLIYEGSTLGSSQAIDKDILLPAYGEAVINAVMIQVPLLNMLSSAYKMYLALQSGKEIKLIATTITTIDLGWNKIPFEKQDAITLKKANK